MYVPRKFYESYLKLISSIYVTIHVLCLETYLRGTVFHSCNLYIYETIIIIIIAYYHRFPPPGTSPLERFVHHTTQTSSFILYLLCAVSIAQLFLVEKLLNAFLALFPGIFSPLVTVPVVPLFTGMTKHFIFHIG